MWWNKHRTIVALSVLGIVIGSLPYLIGLVMRPTGYSLLGTTPLAAGDVSVYYSYVEQGRQGHWLMRDVFTADQHPATIWQPLWFVVGQLGNIFHLSTPWAYALARVAAAPLLIGAIWWLTGWLWSAWRTRVSTTLLTAIASGFGGALSAWWPQWVGQLGYGSIDQWISEAFTHLTLIGSPHFILVTAGIIFTLVSIERSWEERKWQRMVWASMAALGVVSIHPFHVITWALLAVAMTVYHWWHNHRFPRGYVARWLVLAAVVSPVLLLYALQLAYDPLTAIRATQNLLQSPALLRTVLGLGLLLPLGLWGMWRQFRVSNRWAFVTCWAIITVFAMYFPLTFQRRLSQGLSIPWTMLTVSALSYVMSRLRQRSVVVANLTIAALVLLLGWTWLSTIGRFVRVYTGQINGQPGHTYFLSPDQQASLQYIRSARPAAPILGSLHDSNIVAGLTTVPVFVGHVVETIDYHVKADVLDRFYRTTSDTERRSILAYYHICTLIDGPQERALGPLFHPAAWTDLQPVWTSATVTIYHIDQCAG